MRFNQTLHDLQALYSCCFERSIVRVLIILVDVVEAFLAILKESKPTSLRSDKFDSAEFMEGMGLAISLINNTLCYVEVQFHP